MPALLSNHSTLFHHNLTSSAHTHRGERPQATPSSCKNAAGRRWRIHGLTTSLGIRYGRNRDVGVESAKHLEPLSVALLSSSPAPTLDKVALPTLSFSSENIFHCDFHDGVRSDVLNANHDIHFRSLSSDLRIRSVTHPNSPYVPWSEHQRQCILASAETLGSGEGAAWDSHNKWSTVPSTSDTTQRNQPRSLRNKIIVPIATCLRLLCKSSMHSPSFVSQRVTLPVAHSNDSTTTLSSAHSVESNSLEDWLAEKQRENSLVGGVFSPDDEQADSWVNHPSAVDPSDVEGAPPRLQPTTFDFSLDCIPSPSSTIISLPCIYS
ncbi:hypothetical protein D9756_003929 [Leucocoprinus leucothites]|uniref:Uncharacterized protein n=1 Tax=Leucocoprinus leucothites TaxID=201217 RepID=A0A8H5D9F7_9AGAR|nr:hypothetical protein D9756_003929 [Leucoagaricus leucothites]